MVPEAIALSIRLPSELSFQINEGNKYARHLTKLGLILSKQHSHTLERKVEVIAEKQHLSVTYAVVFRSFSVFF